MNIDSHLPVCGKSSQHPCVLASVHWSGRLGHCWSALRPVCEEASSPTDTFATTQQDQSSDIISVPMAALEMDDKAGSNYLD